MNVASNAKTGYFRWAPPPGNDRIESSITYLALVVMTVLIFSIVIVVTQQRQLRNNLQLANTFANAFNTTLHDGERITRNHNACNKESNDK